MNQGSLLFEAETIQLVPGRKTKRLMQQAEVKNPKLWSVEHPTLCQLRTRVFSGEELLDEVDTTFGFRTAVFDAERWLSAKWCTYKNKGNVYS